MRNMLTAKNPIDSLHVCWQCLEVVEIAGPFCPQCHAIQPVVDNDPFRCLGLPHEFSLSSEEIESKYITVQRLVHPDRFVQESPKARLFAQQQAAAVNDAYRLLKDPYERALALLGTSGAKSENDKDDPEALQKIFFWRLRAAEAESLEEITSYEAELAQALMSQEQDMQDAFAHQDKVRLLQAARQFRYLTKLLLEIKNKKSTLAEPHTSLGKKDID